MTKHQPATITHIAKPSHVLRDLSELSEDELRVEVLRLRDELIGAQAEIGNLRSRIDLKHRGYVTLMALHRAQKELGGPDAEYARIARRFLGFVRWAVLRAPRRLAGRALGRG